MVVLGGWACTSSSDGTKRLGTPGAGGSQAGASGAAGAAGGGSPQGAAGSGSPQGAAGSDSSQGAAGSGSPQGAAGSDSSQGTAGSGSPQGTAGSGSPQGTAGAGTGGGTAGSGAAGSTQDGGAGSGPIDAPVSETGSNGTAPGIGQDSPSPPKPMVGTYLGKTQRDLQFSASSVDPMAKNGHAGENQNFRFDSSKPTKWKLIVLLPGIGGGPGGLGTSGWIASQGYHEMDVAYDSAIPGAPNKPDPRANDPACVGNTRMNQFDAKGRMPSCGDDACTAGVMVQRADSIEERVMRGLKHAAELDPMGGWDWYLNADGTVRWSDAGFYGYSYGATHAAVISVFVRLGLVVVGSGPWNESHPEATWIRTASATPGSRAYAIFGKLDGRYPDYAAETKMLGWGPGPYPFELATLTTGALTDPIPWYMGSHSLQVDNQGHTEFCAGSNSVCLYAFDHAGQQ
jgi:hypothetical protein